MVYFSNEEILIRDMVSSDAQIITDLEIKQGWNQTIDKYNKRLKDQEDGKSYAIVAEYKGCIAGYINVYLNSDEGPYKNLGIPEIVDLGVLKEYRNKGIGNKLLDIAEDISSKHSDQVFLAVGLHNGYGEAQRMYVKRGYIPDGSGVWYEGQVLPQYEKCVNDDSLVLFFAKSLTKDN